MNTQRMTVWAGLAALGLVGTAAAADKAPELAPQATIPFVNMGSIRDWQADKRDGLWIQDSRRQWYYARTMSPCLGLDFATTIGFDTRRSGTLDRFSSIIVPRDGRCQISSLTRSEAPPKKVKKKKPEAAGAQATD
jgi:hypothetical protein